MKEEIIVEMNDGQLADTFDRRMQQLLNDPAVSMICGPVVTRIKSNPAGNYATYLYTIWYRKG